MRAKGMNRKAKQGDTLTVKKLLKRITNTGWGYEHIHDRDIQGIEFSSEEGFLNIRFEPDPPKEDK